MGFTPKASFCVYNYKPHPQFHPNTVGTHLRNLRTNKQHTNRDTGSRIRCMEPQHTMKEKREMREKKIKEKLEQEKKRKEWEKMMRRRQAELRKLKMQIAAAAGGSGRVTGRCGSARVGAAARTLVERLGEEAHE